MPAPIDYSVQIADPTQAFLGAFQTGASVQEARLKQEQQQQQMANQKLIQEGFNKLRQPGATAADYANLAMVLPETQAKAVRESFSMLSGERQQNALQQSGQVFSAFKAGKPEIAISLLDRQIEAKRNSGDNEGAMFLETWRDVAKENPKATEDYFGFTISQMPGGDKVIESSVKLGGERRDEALFPSKLGEAQSNAQKAAVDAKFAESNAALDLQKKGWDITKLQEDIKINKLNSQIAAMNAATAKETNALRRDELKLQIQDKREKLDSAIREKAAEVESARADMDNFLNTADRILKTPEGAVKAATGPVDARIPTMQRDVADFEALVETLGSQAFMAQIPKMKGTGALSEGEGKKLQASLQNLSLSQSPEQLLSNVKEAQRLILKGRSLLAKKAGIPDTVPDTPAAAPSANDIDALLKKYGGK
jgi:hypothetical protein